MYDPIASLQQMVNDVPVSDPKSKTDKKQGQNQKKKEKVNLFKISID